MRGKDLLRGIGGIDADLIEEALEPVNVHQFDRWYLPGVAAVCLIIGTVLGATFWHSEAKDDIGRPLASVEESAFLTDIPILNKERLLIWTEEMIYIVNREGQIERIIEDAVLLGEEESFGGIVIQEDTELNLLYEENGRCYYNIEPVKEDEKESEQWNQELSVTEEEFFRRNQEHDIQGTGLFIKAADTTEGKYLIGLYAEDGNAEYYLCDQDFYIIKNDLNGFDAMREYPAGMLVFEQTASGSLPWYLVNMSADKLMLKAVWKNRRIETTFPLEETEYLLIESAEGNGNPLCIHGRWQGRQCSVFLINDRVADMTNKGRFSIQVSDQQVVRLTETEDNSGMETVKTFYVQENGQWIQSAEDEAFYWVNHILGIRKNQDGLFVQTNDGNTSIKIIESEIAE